MQRATRSAPRRVALVLALAAGGLFAVVAAASAGMPAFAAPGVLRAGRGHHATGSRLRGSGAAARPPAAARAALMMAVGGGKGGRQRRGGGGGRREGAGDDAPDADRCGPPHFCAPFRPAVAGPPRLTRGAPAARAGCTST